MSRSFLMLVVRNRHNQPYRFRKQIGQPYPIGTKVKIACGEAAGDLGNLELEVQESCRQDIVARPHQARKADSYDILRMPGDEQLIFPDSTRLTTLLKEDGWERF